jgi:hypothetical protein
LSVGRGVFCQLGGVFLSVGAPGEVEAVKAAVRPGQRMLGLVRGLDGEAADAAATPQAGEALQRHTARPRREVHERRETTRVRCVSLFLDNKNRRYIGKSQSKRPPERTQRTPHRASSKPSSTRQNAWIVACSGP